MIEWLIQIKTWLDWIMIELKGEAIEEWTNMKIHKGSYEKTIVFWNEKRLLPTDMIIAKSCWASRLT